MVSVQCLCIIHKYCTDFLLQVTRLTFENMRAPRYNEGVNEIGGVSNETRKNFFTDSVQSCAPGSASIDASGIV